MSLVILKSKQELQKLRCEITGSIGFVPTMGNLHQGHISLLQASLEQNENTFFSIYVNPTQFGAGEDLEKYPRTLADDIEKIKALNSNYPSKNIFLYTPTNQDIYPDGFDTIIMPGILSNVLEGKFRPTHFQGVCTVVYLLLHSVKPTCAYFGQKDFQQLVVIKQMVKDLDLNIKIVSMPIIREEDGLAMSSRNQYLDPQQRKQALTLSLNMKKIQAQIISNGLKSANDLCHELMQADKNWNYLEIRNSQDLSCEINNKSSVVIIGTYQLGQTRLLDNLTVDLGQIPS